MLPASKISLAPQRSSTHALRVAKRDLFSYIESYYNLQRLRSAIGYITPD